MRLFAAALALGWACAAPDAARSSAPRDAALGAARAVPSAAAASAPLLLPARVVVERRGGRSAVPLEDYVLGVVAGELAWYSAPSALLEAQAIAARSYAAAVLDAKRRRGLDVVLPGDEAGQVYAPPPVPGSPSQAAALERLRRAVRDTAGEVLLLGGAIVDARYSASCGGTTAAFGDVFAEPLAGSAAMVARRCAPGAVERPWEARVDAAALAALWTELGLGTSAKRLAVTARDAHGRWLEVELAAGGKRRAMSAAELRQRLGAALVKSTRIERCVPPLGTPIEGDLTLAGTGFGHGVGLCQAGARALAESGADAAAILAHYYPEARAERLRVAAAGTEPQ